jgi:hypothetical protein
MPLKQGTSHKTFVKNLETEMKTKPKKQALAIAYAEQRKAAGKKKK